MTESVLNQTSAEKVSAVTRAHFLAREEVLQNNRKYWLLRRFQDVFFCTMGLIILAPLLFLIAAMIIIDSPGASPIYVQTRVGRDGKPFKLYKFRSMCANAEKQLDKLLKYNEMNGPVFKIKDDPRVTRVGRFIRKTSLDELPQLFNVIRGDMSLVGPRPALPREVEQYDDYARQRLFVTPGLTCYWQVQPKRNDLSFEQWLELDLQYIAERSFVVDWTIIIKTFRAMVNMDGE